MKILLFYYPPGGGGKFIANCLSSGFNVAFANFEVAQKILQTRNIDLLKQCLNNTIPQKKYHKCWHLKEPGCIQLFGEGINSIKRPFVTHGKDKFNDLSLLGDVWLPLIAHESAILKSLIAHYSNHNIATVLVQPTSAFLNYARKLKFLENSELFKASKAYPLSMFLESNVDVDFDFVIDDWDPRVPQNLNQITALANAMQIPIDLPGISEYINRYLDFHTIDI